MDTIPSTVSVALCTYNGAAFVDEQLASIAAQTHLPSELVVVDDGSEDATIAAIERFAASALFPVRIHRNPATLGYRANFIRAAGLCRGELIFFCDQDDIWLADKIERMRAVFADPRVLLGYHNAILVDDTGHGDALLYDDDAQRSALAQTPMPPWHYTLGFTQAFRRSLLTHDRLWIRSLDHMTPGVMAHDQWYIFLAAALGRVDYVPTPLVRHRQHGHNTYGVAENGHWRRFASRFRHRSEWDRLARDAARRRGELLMLVAPETNARSRIAQARLRYDVLADRHGRRLEAYSATAGRRWRAFASSVICGDYAGRPWGLAPYAIARDLLLGVILGKDDA